MSAAAVPEPDDRGDRSENRPGGESCALSDRDRRILDEIAAHETGSDPAFAGRLRGPRWRIGGETQRVIQILVVAVVAVVVLPQFWSVITFWTAVAVAGSVLFGRIHASAVVRDRSPRRRRETD